MLRLDVPYFHFERMHSIMGLENTLLAFVEEPEATHEVLAQLTDYYIHKMELIKCVKACHDLGMYFEQHTCGHIQEIIPDLCEIGVDILQPLMASCNDIPIAKREYGEETSGRSPLSMMS